MGSGSSRAGPIPDKGTPAHYMYTNLSSTSCNYLKDWSIYTVHDGPLHFPVDGTFSVDRLLNLRAALVKWGRGINQAQWDSFVCWYDEASKRKIASQTKGIQDTEKKLRKEIETTRKMLKEVTQGVIQSPNIPADKHHGQFAPLAHLEAPVTTAAPAVSLYPSRELASLANGEVKPDILDDMQDPVGAYVTHRRILTNPPNPGGNAGGGPASQVVNTLTPQRAPPPYNAAAMGSPIEGSPRPSSEASNSGLSCFNTSSEEGASFHGFAPSSRNNTNPVMIAPLRQLPGEHGQLVTVHVPWSPADLHKLVEKMPPIRDEPGKFEEELRVIMNCYNPNLVDLDQLLRLCVPEETYRRLAEAAAWPQHPLNTAAELDGLKARLLLNIPIVCPK